MRCRQHGTNFGVVLLCGCASVAPQTSVTTDPSAQEASVASRGAIYRDGHDLRLFEHHVARNVGDILTVRLSETTDASKTASTTTKKSSKVTMPGPVFAGRPVTIAGTAVLSGSIANDTGFSGEGASKQSNRLYGDVTVTVERRLTNGDLLVRGEKSIVINQGRESIQVSGIVRPVDIEPDNSVLSTRLGKARISYSGRGAIDETNTPGVLSRVFNAPWLPF